MLRGVPCAGGRLRAGRGRGKDASRVSLAETPEGTGRCRPRAGTAPTGWRPWGEQGRGRPRCGRTPEGTGRCRSRTGTAPTGWRPLGEQECKIRCSHKIDNELALLEAWEQQGWEIWKAAHRRRSEVIRLFLIVGWAHNQNISYHIKPGIAGNIIDIGQIPGFVS